MNVTIKIITLIAFSLTPLLSLAEPSKPIATFMETPASAFDTFLFRLRDKNKCPYDGSLFCLAEMNYDFSDNNIEMTFSIDICHMRMKEFSGMNKKEKENILKDILSGIAQNVGVKKLYLKEEDIEFDVYYGWIQRIPIRHGWGTDNLNVKEIREEIRKRTRLVMWLSTNNGEHYTVVRSHHGETTIKTRPNNSQNLCE